MQNYVTCYGLFLPSFSYRHPEANGRPQSSTMLRTLQKSDRNLLQWTTPEDDQTDGQAAVLGAPLSCGVCLYADLQEMYITDNSESAL